MIKDKKNDGNKNGKLDQIKISEIYVKHGNPKDIKQWWNGNSILVHFSPIMYTTVVLPQLCCRKIPSSEFLFCHIFCQKFSPVVISKYVVVDPVWVPLFWVFPAIATIIRAWFRVQFVMNIMISSIIQSSYIIIGIFTT